MGQRKNQLLIVTIMILSMVCFSSCSSHKKNNTAPIATATLGLISNPNLTFPLYLTDQIESRSTIVQKSSEDVFIIYTGNILKASASKSENEAILESLVNSGIDLINLSIEDFTIADQQEISFDKYPLNFLNSTVFDLQADSFIESSNITPYKIYQNVVFIGLSKKNEESTAAQEKFLVNDYVMATLRAKKLALKELAKKSDTPSTVQSFMIVHSIGAEITDVLERLPPSFINSLTN